MKSSPMGKQKIDRLSQLKRELYDKARHSRYSLMSFAGLFFGSFLLFTSPIWMLLLFFNLPVLLSLYFIISYTNVRLPPFNHV